MCLQQHYMYLKPGCKELYRLDQLQMGLAHKLHCSCCQFYTLQKRQENIPAVHNYTSF